MPKRTLGKTHRKTCKAKGQNRPLQTKVKYVPRGLHTPLSPLPFYLIRTSHFCRDCRNSEEKGRVGCEIRNSGGCHQLLQRHTFGKKTTDVVVRERKQLYALCCISLPSLPIRLAGQVCKRQCCSSHTVRADDMMVIPLRQIGRQLLYYA